MGRYEIFIIFHIPGIKEMERDGGDKMKMDYLMGEITQRGTP